MSSDDTPLFSRNASTSALGKCSEDIKTLVPEEVKNHLSGLAVLHNKTLSEYVRDLLVSHVYGHLHAVRLQHGFAGGRAAIGQESDR